MMRRVLVVNENLAVCKKIKYSLQNDGTDVYYATSIDDALNCFARYSYQLVIMDTRFSEINGVQIVEKMRQAKPVPILVLSSGNEKSEHVEALEAGADLVLEQNRVDLDVLLAHAEALMRRYTILGSNTNQTYTLVFGKDLIIDPDRREVTLQGQRLDMTRKQFDMLLYLASNAGQVLSREQIYEHVWPHETVFDVDAAVNNRVADLRNVMGKGYIQTVWGVGYRFNPKPDDKSPDNAESVEE